MNLETFTSKKAIEIDSASLAVLRGPGVYMYVKDDLAIYVGSAHHLACRCFGKQHHKLSEIQTGTSVLMFPCETYEQARQLEDELILDLRPRFNGRSGRASFAKLMGIDPASCRYSFAHVRRENEAKV